MPALMLGVWKPILSTALCLGWHWPVLSYCISPSFKKPHNNWHPQGCYKEWSNNVYKMFWTFSKESSLKTYVLFPQGGVSFAPGGSWMMNSLASSFNPAQGVQHGFRTLIKGQTNKANMAGARPPSAREMWARRGGQRCLEQVCLHHIS